MHKAGGNDIEMNMDRNRESRHIICFPKLEKSDNTNTDRLRWIGIGND